MHTKKVASSDFHSPIEARVILSIRWVAIIGQIAALFCAAFFFQLELPLLPSLFVISSSVFVNLWQIHNLGKLPFDAQSTHDELSAHLHIKCDKKIEMQFVHKVIC